MLKLFSNKELYMLYTKLRIDFKNGPKDRFYRVILVKGNPNLFKLGIAIGTILGALFEHCFLITVRKDSICYVMSPFMEEPLDGYKYLGNHKFKELPDEFDFEYDTGDGYDFTCKKEKELVEFNSDKEYIILEGRGQGIWEDNIHTLYKLFNNEIDPELNESDDEKGIYKPWNFFVYKFSDFDLPLDIKRENKAFDKVFDLNYRELKKADKEYAEVNNIDLEDYDESRDIAFYLLNIWIDEIEEQIKENKDVKSVFEAISKKKDEFIAKELMAVEFSKYCFEIRKKKISFDEKEYLRRLENLSNGIPNSF